MSGILLVVPRDFEERLSRDYAPATKRPEFYYRCVSLTLRSPAGRYKVVITTDGPSSRLIPASITALHSTKLIVGVPEEWTQDLKLDLSKYK